MTEPVLTKTRIHAGVWEGLLSGAGDAPQIEVTHQGARLLAVTVQPVPGRPGDHAVQIPIPTDALSEGVQTFVIREGVTGVTLGSFAVVTGSALDEDIRAELDLLRAELDMLKRAFRRHCVETTG